LSMGRRRLSRSSSVVLLLLDFWIGLLLMSKVDGGRMLYIFSYERMEIILKSRSVRFLFVDFSCYVEGLV
jgi:hypothetical protein